MKYSLFKDFKIENFDGQNRVSWGMLKILVSII